MSNDNYITGMRGFNVAGEGTVDEFYEGAAGIAPGAGPFTACALFQAIRRPSSEIGIWGNYSGDNPAVAATGWSLTLDSDVLTARVIDTPAIPAIVEITADLSGGAETPYLDQWILVHMVADTANNLLRLYLQGTQVGTVALAATGVVASADTPKVGVFGTTPVLPALDQLLIAGVAYADNAFTAVLIELHFQNCQQAFDMAKPNAASPAAVFTNRWRTRDAVDPAAPNGTLIDAGPPPGQKAVGTLPVGAAIWTPADGVDNLTRSGTPDLMSVKNQKWYNAGDIVIA